MAEPKTRPTAASVQAHVDALADPAQRAQCAALIELMSRATGAAPVMWGPSIVGFGTLRQTYASGRTADWFETGFAARRRELTVYVMDGFDAHAAPLARLGRHRLGKCCLYLRSLDDIDLAVLRELIDASLRRIREPRA